MSAKNSKRKSRPKESSDQLTKSLNLLLKVVLILFCLAVIYKFFLPGNISQKIVKKSQPTTIKASKIAPSEKQEIKLRRCSSCLLDKPTDEFWYGHTDCNDCRRAKRREKHKNSKYPVWHTSKTRAKQNGLEFNLPKNWATI